MIRPTRTELLVYRTISDQRFSTGSDCIGPTPRVGFEGHHVSGSPHASPVPAEARDQGAQAFGPALDIPLSLWLCATTTKPIGGPGMKKLIIVGTLVLIATGAHAQYYGTGSNPNSHSVQGHVTTSGTYVQPYQATNPN